MALGKINFYPLKKQWNHETTFSDWLAGAGPADDLSEYG